MPSPEPFRLLYTGPRLLTDPEAVARDLDEILRRHPHLQIHEGGCPTGGDKFTREWAARRRAGGDDVECRSWPAPWDQLGKIAGPMRNGFLAGLIFPAVSAGHGGCLAHQRDGSTGSAGCAAFAEWAGIPVWRRDA